MSTSLETPPTETETRIMPGTMVPMESIVDPGCYVCNWNGFLLRVEEECLNENGTTTFEVIGNGPLFVTYLSDDPYCEISEARTFASVYGVPAAF